MKTITLASPAKINLFLRILRRRPDGYHELASLFQTISLCDTLHFSLAHQDHLTCTDPLIPTDHTNLILKAADLFRRQTNLDVKMSIHLEKRIPIQAGLGGGSSNAATALWAYNELCGRPATLEQLTSWSSEIGSDIPFFFSEGSAYCTGRGEIIRHLPALPSTSLQIFKPKQGLSTPEIYGKLNAATLEPRNPDIILAKFLNGEPTYFNDLEIPAFATLPQLTDLKAKLQSSGFSDVLMSGSGSAFFCLGNGSPKVDESVQSFSTSFIQRSINAWYQLP